MAEKGQAPSQPVKLWDDLSPVERKLIAKSLKELPAQQQERANGKSPKSTFQLKGYLRCELAAADKEAFKAWDSDQAPGSVGGSIISLADSGYLVKLGESGNGFQASLCAATTNKEWEGYVLTAHASSAVRAASLLLFKHSVMMQSDWSPWLAEDSEDFLR